MSSVLGEANAIIHEIQVEFSGEVSPRLRHYIENMMVQCVNKNTNWLEEKKDEWMNGYLKIMYPNKE